MEIDKIQFVLRVKMDIPKIIQQLPINVIHRMKMEKTYIVLTKYINGMIGSAKETSKYYPLVRNNRFYGNEYVLKKYCGVKQSLYAIIEHGLYLGNNCAKVGLSHEWELGCILTYGDYRKKIINEVFPDYYCETVGPLIHYAQEDLEYRRSIESMLVKDKKTLLFFPVHGNTLFSPHYNMYDIIDRIKTIASERECLNIIVSVMDEDMEKIKSAMNDLADIYNVIITRCVNRFDETFLGKQKALINLSDITVSNNLGTLLGHCIYLNKPHILLQQEIDYQGNAEVLDREFGKVNRSENWRSDFENEKIMFQNIFNENTYEITQEQKDICEYYWGFSKIKSTHELKAIFEMCYRKSREYIEQK